MKRNNISSPQSGKKAKKSKLASIFDKLESKNSAFLSTAAQSNNAFELAQSTADAASKPPSTSYTTPSRKLQSHPLKFSSQGSPGSIAKLPMDNEEGARRAERRQRFLAEQQDSLSRPSETLVEARAAHGIAVQGQNTNLEKDYLRLTSLPDITDVRPPEVLEQALALVQQKWKEGCIYKYACDQLKSIRQDLTVQHVRSALTVAVYETHARVAIESGDMAELRQNLAVLGTLYVELKEKLDSTSGSDDGCVDISSSIEKGATTKSMKKKQKRKSEISGSDEKTRNEIRVGLKNQSEFMSYNLMLAAATGRSVLAHELKECASRGLFDDYNEDEKVPQHDESSPPPSFLQHALSACKAASSTGDFVSLLKLYDSSPRMAPYLLDLLVDKVRPKTYSTLLAAYGGPGGLPFGQAAIWLGFAKKKEAATWIRERGGVIIRSEDGGKVLDVKASREGLKAYLATTTGAAVGASLTPR